jgi:hypothetical protein
MRRFEMRLLISQICCLNPTANRNTSMIISKTLGFLKLFDTNSHRIDASKSRLANSSESPQLAKYLFHPVMYCQLGFKAR